MTQLNTSLPLVVRGRTIINSYFYLGLIVLPVLTCFDHLMGFYRVMCFHRL